MTRILLVDDHEVLRQGLAKVLQAGIPGLELGEAACTSEALQRLEAGAWDLVLVDIHMPGRNGLALLEEIRGRRLKVPALVLTGYPEDALAVRCLRLGAAGYLTKASASEELLLAVRQVLEGGRYVTAALREHLASVVSGQRQAEAHELLSSRELQVLRMVASGRSQKEIAQELHLSEKTIATYRARIGEKLGVSRTAELVRYAMVHKLAD